MTGCHSTRIWTQSQQLRLHESTNLHCHSVVSAGAILEDCTRLVFHTSSQLEVKDFNWLKQGEASPNYSIEDSKAEPEVLVPERPEPTASTYSKPQLGTSLRSIPTVENDDDDEL